MLVCKERRQFKDGDEVNKDCNLPELYDND
jgi:hypothetical protein